MSTHLLFTFDEAYGQGVADGYHAGYVTGYVDAARHRDPEPAYADEIGAALDHYHQADAVASVLQRLPGSMPCGCIGICYCT